jgi:adenosylmethionine-8-amino-7-oxononanoate aminotransferase
MCGIELVRDRRSGEAYEPALRAGARVVEAALPHGVLLRPLGNVLVLMPPLSISAKEMDLLTGVAFRCLDDVTRAL